MKKKAKRICIVLGIVIALLGVAFLLINPYLGNAKMKNQDIALDTVYTKAEAVADMEAIMKKCKSVDYLFLDQVPPTFQQQYDKEIRNFGESVTRLELWQASARLFSSLQCGHHGIYTWLDGQKEYDVDYQIQEDMLQIQIESQWYSVEKINEASAQDILKNGSEMLFYENEFYRDYSIVSYLKSDVTLALLTGKMSEACTITYLDQGEERQYEAPLWQENQAEPTGAQEDFVFYEIKEAENLAVFTLNSCRYNKQYKEVLQQFFTQVKEKGITNIAVDLRQNGGGSSLVANEFVKYLDVEEVADFDSFYRMKFLNGKGFFSTIKGGTKKDLLYQGKVYVLTSTETFSSAMQFAVLLQDNKLAQVTGEPCGNRPSQYGEVVCFKMPHSKLFYTGTISYFERPNKAEKEALYAKPDYWVDAETAMEKLQEII